MQQTKKFKMADAISPYLAVSCGLILCIWNDQKIWGGIQNLDQKLIWDEKSQLHEIDA